MQLKLTVTVPNDHTAADVVADLLTLTAASARLRASIANPAGEFSGSGVIRDPRTNDVAGMWELAPEEVTA